MRNSSAARLHTLSPSSARRFTRRKPAILQRLSAWSFLVASKSIGVAPCRLTTCWRCPEFMPVGQGGPGRRSSCARGLRASPSTAEAGWLHRADRRPYRSAATRRRRRQQLHVLVLHDSEKLKRTGCRDRVAAGTLEHDSRPRSGGSRRNERFAGHREAARQSSLVDFRNRRSFHRLSRTLRGGLVAENSRRKRPDGHEGAGHRDRLRGPGSRDRCGQRIGRPHRRRHARVPIVQQFNIFGRDGCRCS